jgi:hypothetical protein
MRSRFWILLCRFTAWRSRTRTDPAKRQLVLQVSNGGFVAFRSETPGSKSVPESKSLESLLYSQAFAARIESFTAC